MKETWDLSRIYESEEAFQKDFLDIKERVIPALESLKGQLNQERKFSKYLSLMRESDEKISRLYMFCSMRSDLDKRVVENNSAVAKMRTLLNDFSAAISYADPEILSLGKDYVELYFKNHPEDKDFDFEYEKLFRGADYVLPAALEKLATCFSPLQSMGGTLYSQLSVSDYVPKKVTLKDGSEVEVNQANWTTLVSEAKCEEDRKAIFESLYSYYDEHKNVYGEIYNAVLQSQLAEMKARGYSSILQSHLYRNKIDESVFLNLIDVASTHAAPLHKYLQIRAKYLGLEKYHTYDRFLSLAESDKKYTYEEARELFFKSIEKFPADFQAKAHEVSAEGYVDVYHQPGKRTGAYSNGGENVHPYILLNFNGQLEDVFTLAHESGHSIHTLYSMESQPVMKQSYTIFVAEIASTFNEHNLLDYLMESGELSKQDKIALLQKSIDQIMSTFYRQTLFAHYEYNISKKVEQGIPLNYEILCQEMISLYKTYYGLDIQEEKVKPFVWAYIPHLFYSPFYVYQYATSFTASMLIYENVKKGKANAFENYIQMLRSGGSTYPIDEVKIAGVDLTKKEAFLAVTSRMEELVDQLEKLLFE